MDASSNQADTSSFKFDHGFLKKRCYEPPSWASHLSPIPSHVFSLGHFPTPIHKWNLPNLPKNTEVWLKREDLSGLQLSGNKARKLEFLLADVVAQEADCIVTIGGIQSNHCRATAVAAKYLNLDCYLILFTSKAADKDPGLTGNLLVERLVGAHIDLVSKEELEEIGFTVLTDLLKERSESHMSSLLAEQTPSRPGEPNLLSRSTLFCLYIMGLLEKATWGFIEAIREIEQQLETGNYKDGFDDIVAACGSGGTITGLAIGSELSKLKAKVHAYGVVLDPGYYYYYSQAQFDEFLGGVSSRDILDIQNARGLGYSVNTAEELKFVKEVAESTGVILDPIYSGKAAFGWMKDMAENPTKWEGRKVLFIHTGGLFSLFDKADEMLPLVGGKWRKMDIPVTIAKQEGTGMML